MKNYTLILYYYQNIIKMLTIEEQESFMHRIYDVIHNGIGMNNLIYSLKSLQERFGNLSTILNTRMKNEDIHHLLICQS